MRAKPLVQSAVGVFILLLVAGSAFGATIEPTGASVPGEVLVKVQAGASRDDIAGLERAGEVAESERIADVRGGSLFRMRSRSRNSAALINALQKNPKVEYAEPNFILEPVATPNDPQYPQLWALKNALAGVDINAEAAWNVTTGSKSIVVGVVDTGVNYLHPDLAPNMWSNPGGKGNAACAAGTHGFNARTNTCDPMDDHYHGSHVAGTIGAAGNNGIGVAGVNWNVSIMALKFLGNASDASGTIAGAIAAINFAVQAKIDGVNVRVLCNSWGGGGFSKALLDIINKANEHDILFVAAAGNNATDNEVVPHYPSSYQTLNMIAVAATDSYDELAPFSNWGANNVHIGAPGVGIYSTSLGESYVSLNGTSMATPHVAGVAALVLAKTPSMTTGQLRSTILESGDPVKALAGKTSTGRRLNAAKAVGAPPLPNFSIAVGPTSQNVRRGDSTTYSVTIRPVNGFTGPVDLTVTGLPEGATASFSPASTTTSATLTIATSSTTPLAFSELTIAGVGGGLRRTMWASLSINAEVAPGAYCPAFVVSSRYDVGAATGVVLGDFNRDGKTDLASVSHDRNTLSVLLGHGNQTFLAPVAYPVGSAPMAIATADVNGDAKLDLVAANSGSTTISLLLGNGDGTFQAAVQHQAGANPFAVTSGDFNRDGRSDLAVGNNGASSVTILLSNGDGTFAAPAHYPAASGPYSVVAGDVDSDGDADLAVAAYNANSVAILLNAGNGTFSAPVTYAAGLTPSGVAFADFDRNGALDLAVSNYDGTRTISVLMGNGDGTFRAPLQYTGDSETNFVATGDFNGDGTADIVAGSAGYGSTLLYLGNGNGTFQDGTYTPGGYVEPSQLAVGDINGDGSDDVAVADLGLGSLAVLFNNSACSYNCGTFGAGNVLTAGTTPDGVTAGDFNGDGRGDLAIVNDGGISIRTGNGDGTFATGAAVSAGNDPDAVVAGDFNRDGNADLAVANGGSNDVSVVIGNGDGTFAAAVAYGAGTSPRAIAAGDFNVDGRIDLAVANHGSNDVSVLLGNGNGTFQSAARYATGTAPSGVVAADFNRDGRPDLAVANGGSNDVTILLGNGNGTFQNGTAAAAGTTPAAIATADWNRDGRSDLAIANSGSNDISVLFGNGDGTFQPAFSVGAGNAPSALAAGDFNVDGLADLAVANSGSHNVSVLIGNGRGSFSAATIESGIGPAAVVAADFNGDGKSELAVANSSAGSVSLLLNTCPRPDLTVAKTHSGNFAQGADGQTYTITVRNVGAGATKNMVTVTDVLPSGLRATGISGAGWSCDPITVSCTRSDVLAPGASYPPVTVTVSVAMNAAASVTNQAIVSGGGDASTGNNSATDPTAVVQVTDLVVSLTHAGSFVQGATGRTYSVIARNAGGLATSGTVTVNVALPAALTATAIIGTGWNCTLASLTCTRGDALAGNSSYPVITVTVDVASDAPVEVISTASVAGANQHNAGNDTASDRTLIWSNASCGAFAGAVTYTVGSNPTVLTLGDFNGDGRRDIVVANYYSHTVSVLTGKVDGTFAAAVHSPTGGVYARALEADDLNLDGKLDVVVLNQNTTDISVLLGNGNGTFAAPVTYGAGNAPHSAAIGDVNGDGLPDVAVTNSYFSTISVLLGKGGGTFHPRTAVPMNGISASLTGIRVADLNGDSVLDLIAASENSAVWRFTGNGDGTFKPPVEYSTGSAAQYVATADFNRDGKVDVVVTNQTGAAVSVLIGGGDGSFLAPVRYPLGFGVAFVHVIDINGDGSLDLLASSPNTGSIYTLRGNGDGTFQAATSSNLGGPGQFGVSDFNGDGRPDIAMINNGSNVGVLLGGCADLKVTKTHTGSFSAGQTGTYTVTVTNVGNGSTQGTVTLTDTLPSGMTVSTIGGTGWACSPFTASCTRSDSRIPNSSYPQIYITVNVARTAPASVTNTVTVSGGGDVNTANNGATDPTAIVHVPDLKVTKSHVGLFAQGQTGRVYTIVVGNIGSAATAGVVTVTDNLPRELTATAMSGQGWNCTVSTRSCTREDDLAIDATYPPITLTVNVASDAQLSVINYVTVSGGGDVSTANNSASDWTTILTTPTNVVASTLSASQVSLTWKAVQYATSYRVLRSTSAEGPFTVIGSPLSNSFLDASLAASTTYYYRVQAAEQTVLTAESATVSTTTNGTDTSGAPTQLYLVTPCRLLDTRDSAPIGAQAVQLIQATGACGIPAGAKSLVMNITAVVPVANGYLTVYPGNGSPRPGTSAVSYRTGKTRASNAIIPMSDDGRLAIFNGGSPVHFLIDVTGYFK